MQSEIGAEDLAIRRATRLLLAFLAREMSEMISSGWCLIMLPILYYGPNKRWMYTVDSFGDEDFKRSMLFSGFDFGLEFLTFGVMLLVFSLHAKINVYGVGFEYMHEKHLFLPVFSVSFAIVIVSFAFFIKHNGLDPDFKFDEFTGGENATNN